MRTAHDGRQKQAYLAKYRIAEELLIAPPSTLQDCQSNPDIMQFEGRNKILAL
jgi:hypothetical protein